MTTVDELERQLTLRTAVVRYDELRTRDALAGGPDDEIGVPGERLDRAEALEMLALGELIVRKAGYGRQLGVRAARAAGASWSQIGLALGTSKQSAWEAHARWIDEQVEQHGRSGHQGFDEVEAARARDIAGPENETGDKNETGDRDETGDGDETGDRDETGDGDKAGDRDGVR